jgi:hypothetical protein
MTMDTVIRAAIDPRDPEPPTPGAALAAPTSHPPCPDCGYDAWGTYLHGKVRSYPIHGRCFRCDHAVRRRAAGVPTRAAWLAKFAHPEPLPAVVTPAMLGITRRQIADRCRTAREQLWADEGLGRLAGAAWRKRHPEQFTDANLRRIFGDGLGLAEWTEDAPLAA